MSNYVGQEMTGSVGNGRPLTWSPMDVMVFFDLSPADKMMTKDVPLKQDEVIYRYLSDNPKSPTGINGYYNPLIKVNPAKSKIYFLTEASSNGYIDEIEFESCAVRLVFANWWNDNIKLHSIRANAHYKAHQNVIYKSEVIGYIIRDLAIDGWMKYHFVANGYKTDVESYANKKLDVVINQIKHSIFMLNNKEV